MFIPGILLPTRREPRRTVPRSSYALPVRPTRNANLDDTVWSKSAALDSDDRDRLTQYIKLAVTYKYYISAQLNSYYNMVFRTSFEQYIILITRYGIHIYNI